MRRLTLAVLFVLVMVGGARAGDNEDINGLLDAWHRAAAVADEDGFFGCMDEDAVYLGTDASERWLRDEFREWAAPYFQRESAWEFVPYDRTLYLSADGSIAWFEEYLETWMGVCRGSGVLQKKAGGWKLKHYHLAVTVPNELMKEFKAIFDKPPADTEGTAEFEVMATVDRLFDGMRAGKGEIVRSVLDDEVRLASIGDKDGNGVILTGAADGFIAAVNEPRDNPLNELIWDYEVYVDGHLATVWMKYVFQLGEQFSHCGVNSFQLIRRADGWKIFNVADTRRAVDCPEVPENAR